jgi:hypothetical protein
MKHESRQPHDLLLLLLFLAASGVIASFLAYKHFLLRESVKHVSNFDAPVFRTSDESMASMKSSSVNECLAMNSEQWIKGPRLSNNHQGNIDFEMSMAMILNELSFKASNGKGHLKTLLSQTICHEQSRFLNFMDDGMKRHNKTVETWITRLLYLSYHMHQHQGALEEAKLRQKFRCEGLLKHHDIGNFDYECPTSKFLVVSLRDIGLGAAMRLGAVNALFAGIATNRTVIFINKIAIGHSTLRSPWKHASCERGDIQCFFMPPSPCTLTHAEIESAYMLVRGDARKLFKYAEMPPGHENDRVVVGNFGLRPKNTPPGFAASILRYSDYIIDQIRRTAEVDDPRIALLQQAKVKMFEERPFDTSKKYYYFGVESSPHHAALFYIMRPNFFYAEKLRIIQSKVIPLDFEPEFSFGLPIRASDKCLVESECLEFPQYMRVIGQIWNKHKSSILNPSQGQGTWVSNTSIVLTSESQSVLKDKETFENNFTLTRTVPFSYRFITNDHDVMQSTGDPNIFDKSNRVSTNKVSQDEVMLSAISSLKAQLMAKFTVGNCCSNFHLLLFDFLQDGCGAATENVGQCLQENEDPEFRVCCMWSKSAECDAKSKLRKERERQLDEESQRQRKISS